MRFDMHIHSCHSPDSYSKVEDIISMAVQQKLNGISITDHNSFTGSKEALKINNKDIIIIPGAEYSTDKGHLLVYFLKEGLEDIGLYKDNFGRYNSSDIIAAAHEQDALVFIAHPFSRGELNDNSILELVDGIEVYNSRASKWRNINSNTDAMNHALRLNKPFSAGSDAHYLNEIGNAFIDIEAANTDLETIKAAFIESLGAVYGKSSSSIYKARSQFIKSRKANTPYNIKQFIRLFYFGIKELSLMLGIRKKPDEGIYLLKDERIEKHDFD